MGRLAGRRWTTRVLVADAVLLVGGLLGMALVAGAITAFSHGDVVAGVAYGAAGWSVMFAAGRAGRRIKLPSSQPPIQVGNAEESEPGRPTGAL